MLLGHSRLDYYLQYNYFTGWYWFGLRSLPRGSVEDVPTPALVILLLLHVDQPGPLLHLQRGTDIPCICS